MDLNPGFPPQLTLFQTRTRCRQGKRTISLQDATYGRWLLVPKENKSGTSASPCSPPSPWWILHRRPPTSSLKVKSSKRTKGDTATPPGIRSNPCNMALREIVSQALVPSMEVTVASASTSHKACNTCEMHSQPALVERAHWNGEIAASTAGPNLLGNRSRHQSSADFSDHCPSHAAVLLAQSRHSTNSEDLDGAVTTTPLENSSATKK